MASKDFEEKIAAPKDDICCLVIQVRTNVMWETTFWIDGVQTGEPLITTSLDDNTKFIEGIIWGLREVMKLKHVEIRIKYKDT